MSLLTAPHAHLHRASWSRRDQRADTGTRALLGQLTRFALALTGACGLLTLMVVLKTAAYLSHHPM
ncbi:hypothetical protein [Bradyrhizobium oligotrophicum]|uniref:hypothetical protein n=1 Tax=Bradyrhizobium oligotrophicum TaxID=44255 RepID=UPI000349DCDB|nr:hypothetical protein [Bradyrhizobium oligotrophicum]